MVKQWAEKELKNLNRLASEPGIRCPRPVALRSNVLVMEFIGSEGWPAPRLKDAELEEGAMRACYLQTVRMMRIMYQKCRLVHGDLSEYNMLYHKGKVVIIDVSQSVELDHPRALDFLRVDCVNVTRFFLTPGRGVENALPPRMLFDFILDKRFGTDDEAMDRALEELERKAGGERGESLLPPSKRQ